MSDSTGPQISFTAAVGKLESAITEYVRQERAAAWREGFDLCSTVHSSIHVGCIANPYDPADKGDCPCDKCMPVEISYDQR